MCSEHTDKVRQERERTIKILSRRSDVAYNRRHTGDQETTNIIKDAGFTALALYNYYLRQSTAIQPKQPRMKDSDAAKVLAIGERSIRTAKSRLIEHGYVEKCWIPKRQNDAPFMLYTLGKEIKC